VQLRQNIEQERAGQALIGEARHRAQEVQRRIVDDARAALPPASSGASQNLAAAAMLLRTMSEPSTTEGRRIQGKLKNLLEHAAVRQAEKLCLPKARAPLGASRNALPTHAGGLGPHRAHAGRDACRPGPPRRRATPPRPSSPPRREGARGYHPRRGGRYDSGEDRSPSPEPPGPQAFSWAIQRAPSRPGSEPRLPSPSTRGRRGRSCGLQTTGWHAS
jgi:hypothetical protein